VALIACQALGGVGSGGGCAAQQVAELGEGVFADCGLHPTTARGKADAVPEPSLDMASLSAMLNAKWKSGPASGTSRTEPVRAGEVRSFRITKLDAGAKRIELELA
jgi:small subunit ribosomal protein S1